MTFRNKIKNLFKEAKAEVVSFGGSGGLALLGVGLEHGGALLAQLAPSHPLLAVTGVAAQTTGKAMQVVAVPAAGATFIGLVTKFGKAWRDMTRKTAPHKKPVVARKVTRVPMRSMFDEQGWGGNMGVA
jgi:hypothetical protein